MANPIVTITMENGEKENDYGTESNCYHHYG